MAEQALVPELLHVDRFVRRFEAAQARGDLAPLQNFLPDPADPLHLPVLCELVRVDIEFRWSRNEPRPVTEYCREFPRLAGDAQALQAVAFEEYRQRREHGENPEPAEYQQLLRVNTDGWPAPPPAPRDSIPRADGPRHYLPPTVRGQPAVQSGGSGLGPATVTGTYRPPCGDGTNPSADLFPSLFDPTPVRAAAKELFRDVRPAGPKAAQRPAQHLTEFPQVGCDFLGFELIDELGRGAFGRVYLARQKDLAHRYVALKLSTDLFGEPQRLAQLQHTNIVPIYSIHQAAPYQAICMPYFGSTTLADVFKGLQGSKELPTSGKYFVSTLNCRKKSTQIWLAPSSNKGKPRSASVIAAGPAGAGEAAPPPDPAAAPRGEEAVSGLKALQGLNYVRAVLWLGHSLAQGLAHAHAKGILHRDLKPANVLLTDDGQPMLLDFNLSEDTKPEAASVANMGGTLLYMSPEHIEGFRGGKRPVDARSDLYSLGLILYELLTGRPALPPRHGPVSGIIPQMIEDRKMPAPHLRCHNRQVSPAVESIIRHCIDPDPARRYRSARELQEDLERQLAHRPLKYAREASVKECFEKWCMRHPRITSSTTLVVLTCVILLMLPFAFTFRQNRLRELVARDNLAAFRDEVGGARLLLNKVRPDPKQLEEGIALCEQARRRFPIAENAAWQDVPAVCDLPSAAERDAIPQELAEVLLIEARATCLLAEQDKNPERRRAKAELGLRLVDEAESRAGAGRVAKAALLERAELANLLGRTEDARRLRREADDTEPRTALDFFLAALRHSDRKEFGPAIRLLQEATRLQPADSWAWFYQGYCYQETGQFREAVRCYTASLPTAQAGSALFLIYFNRGLAYYQLGRYEPACADLDEAVRLRPKAVEAFINRGLARQAGGQYPQAVADLTRALELDPSVTRLYFLRANARTAAGDAEGARRDRETGLREEPTDELSWIERGVARVGRDAAGALADFDKALDLNPRSMLALQNKAHVLAERMDDPKGALEALNKAVKLYPAFARARVGRGVVLARLGKRKEAIEDAQEALAMDGAPSTFYQVANIYALTSKQSPEDRFEAFPLLAAAFRGGFGLDVVDKDSDMDPIRDAPEFKRVVQAARERQKAGDPKKF